MTPNTSKTKYIERDHWRTPEWLFAALNEEFHFVLDAAASEKNHLCDQYFTADDNALKQDWDKITCGRGSVFCNPPYSRGNKEPFIEKAYREAMSGVVSVLVLPAQTSEKWFPWSRANEIRFIKNGRVSFIHPETGAEVKGPPGGTCIAIFYKQSIVKSNIVISNVDRDSLRERGQNIIDAKRGAYAK